MCGAQSIRQIAKTVGRLPEYELFYAKGSRITHSASYKDHLRFAKGKMFYKHVRQLESINELLNFVVVLALTSYNADAVQTWRDPSVFTKVFGRLARTVSRG